MARGTEALVEPDILKWARSSAGLSVDEAAHSLQTKPEKVDAWESGAESPSMPQLRKMAATYRRLLSDFYLPEPPRTILCRTTSGGCQARWRFAIPRRCVTSSGWRGSGAPLRSTIPCSRNRLSLGMRRSLEIGATTS